MIDLESLFNLSYGMYIIASKKGDRLNGCIVNTAFQVIPEPPMVAVSVNKQNLTHEYITESRIFTISVLAEEAPMPIFGKFGFRSGRDIDKFEDIDYKIGATGAPILMNNVVAFVEAEVIESIDIETHTLFIGKILTSQTIDDSKTPMTYTFYRDMKQGRTPKTAATYHEVKSETKKGDQEMKKYRCLMCGYIYDPKAGDPDSGIEAGTAFENLPDDWTCPECGVGKDEFEPADE